MEQPDLVYSFLEVKNLFDRFNIKQSSSGEFEIVDRNSQAVCLDKAKADQVKFAHTWFAATEFGRSRTTPNPKEVTQDDYSYAFNEEAKRIYDFIMDIASQTMLNGGVLIRKEPLRAEVLEAGLRAHAEDIVDGLYSKKRFLEAFNKWVRACNNMSMTPAELNAEVTEKVSTY